MSEGARHTAALASIRLRLSDQRRPTHPSAAGPERADEGGGPDTGAFQSKRFSQARPLVPFRFRAGGAWLYCPANRDSLSEPGGFREKSGEALRHRCGRGAALRLDRRGFRRVKRKEGGAGRRGGEEGEDPLGLV